VDPRVNPSRTGERRQVSAFSGSGSNRRAKSGEGNSGPGNAANSPLWMVTTEPVLNEFVMDLQRLRHELMMSPDQERVLRFSRGRLQEVRTAFANMIRHGEQRLHLLARLLCDSLLDSYQMESVVIGEVESTRERFTLTRVISEGDLYGFTDIDLGNRELGKLRIHDGSQWSSAGLIANVVEYQPLESNEYAIHRVITRIKAEEEIWNKVVDEIFDLDSIVARDKELRHLSRYVKDIFGLKIVVGTYRDVRRVHQALQKRRWSKSMLTKCGVESRKSSQQLRFVEVKDYLSSDQRKKTGWEAMKSVVQWWDKTFEIQIQPLPNFHHEREYLTRESHNSFKLNREQVRRQVAEQVPLFRFYQDLLQWLFLSPQLPAPVHGGVKALLVE
jgi:hypothetical protein